MLWKTCSFHFWRKDPLWTHLDLYFNFNLPAKTSTRLSKQKGQICMNIAVIYIIILPRGTPTSPLLFLLLNYAFQKMKPNPVSYLSVKQFGPPSRLVLTTSVHLWQTLLHCGKDWPLQRSQGAFSNVWVIGACKGARNPILDCFFRNFIKVCCFVTVLEKKEKKLKSGLSESFVIVLTDADTLFHQLKPPLI